MKRDVVEVRWPSFFSYGGRLETGWQDDTGAFYGLNEAGEIERVRGAKAILQVGERVEFWQSLSIYPADYIEQGERGIVSHVERSTGVVSILLARLHMGLGDNTLTLVPHMDDDAINSIAVLKTAKRFATLSRLAALF